MLRIFKLLLPAVIPSWNFFDVIVPSPRIQFSLLKRPEERLDAWQEFRPRPARLSFAYMLMRLFWNPLWNESLFLVSCAERLMEYPNQHSEDEIFNRIKAALKLSMSPSSAAQVKFRLVFISRQGGVLKEQVRYESQFRPVFDELLSEH